MTGLFKAHSRKEPRTGNVPFYGRAIVATSINSL
jgi:hypothetical protein